MEDPPKILVVGNGFDIAHELPTKYTQFLEFVKVYQCGDESQFPKDCFHKDLFQVVKWLKEGTSNTVREVRDIFTRKNKLLDYFLSVYESRCNEGRTGWIDFEAEIADIIQTFDEARQYAKTQIEMDKKKYSLQDSMFEKLAPFIFARGEYRVEKHYTLPPELLKESAERLLPDLNALTRLLEIYLTEYVEKIQTEKRIPEIYDLRQAIDLVLSFNYTDTYRRLYCEGEIIDCCFIHGKADIDSSLETSSLVLGINEFLEKDRQDNENDFIWFKKFYQRIYKETSSVYIDWLKDDIAARESVYDVLPMYIYFYGHSLDVTDKDVLEKLIMHKNAEIRIFYHCKQEMAKQIKNLTKIIGTDNLIQLTRGRDRKIYFLPASKAQDKVFCEMRHTNNKQ